MAQKRILSSDPYAGDPAGEQKRVVSSDPYAGASWQELAADAPPARVGFYQPLTDAIKRGGEQIASHIDTSDVMAGAPDFLENFMRNTASTAVRTVSNPSEHKGDLGAMLAQLIPALRVAKTGAAVAKPVLSPVISALKNLGSSAWRSAVGGAASQIPEGPAAMASEAVTQGGWDLAGGGLLAGLGAGSRAIGRRFGTKAVAPSNIDLLDFQEAFGNRPEYHTNPGTFIPGRARREFTDELERETMEGRRGAFGGITDANDAVLRADITGAQKEDLMRKTVESVNPTPRPGLYRLIDQAAARGDSQGLEQLLKELEPVTAAKAEFMVNLDDIANAGRERAGTLGGANRGGSPWADREEGLRTVEQFMRRDPDARIVTSPWAALPEPKVPVPLGGGNAGLDDVAGAAQSAGAIPNLERGPRAADAAGTTSPARWRTDLGERPPVGRGEGIGDVMAAHTPTSSLPTPPQFLGEGLGAASPHPTTDAVWWADPDVARAEGLIPPASRGNYVGADTLLKIRQNLDNDLLRARQTQAGAVSAGGRHVPGPSEEVLQALRSAAAEKLNTTVPMGADLRGVPTSLEDLLAQERKDIVMSRIKAQATGETPHTLRARAGISPGGRPSVSLFENIVQGGGAIAKPLIRGGRGLLDAAPRAPHLARLIAMLMQNGGTTSEPMNANLTGVGR